MQTITPTRSSLLATGLPAQAWRRLRDFVAQAAARWRRQQEQRAIERALRELSPAMRRDLGLDAGDFPSIAHAASLGDDTRVRMTQPLRKTFARL